MKKLLIFLFAIFVNNLLPSIIFVNKVKDYELLVSYVKGKQLFMQKIDSDAEVRFDINNDELTFTLNNETINIDEINFRGADKGYLEARVDDKFFLFKTNMITINRKFLIEQFQRLQQNRESLELSYLDKIFNIEMKDNNLILVEQKNGLCVIL